MAYTKKKTASKSIDIESSLEKSAVTEENVAADISNIKGVVFQAKKEIPLDALVYVKNLTGGKLIYKNPRTGYTYIWNEYGEEVPIEMRELINMKNANQAFFTENWIQMDIAVLRDLHMDNYYKDFVSYEDIENLITKDADKIIDKLKNASLTIKNSVGIRALQLIEEKKLTDINVIRALEEVLGCELTERY